MSDGRGGLTMDRLRKAVLSIDHTKCISGLFVFLTKTRNIYNNTIQFGNTFVIQN